MDSKEKQEEKNKELEISEKSFKRIDEQFRQYRKYLFGIVFIYIVSYMAWVFLISG